MKNGIANREVKKAVQTKGASGRARPIAPRSSTKVSEDGKLQRSEQPTPFEKMFEDMLKDIYWAEQHMVEALHTMTEAATTNELKEAFEDHRFVTQKHVSRLDKVFSMLGKKSETKKCDAMDGIIRETERIIKETPEGSMTRDAGLIICAQKAEHYEIASYGSLVQVAYTLGHDDVAYILEKTLRDELNADYQLTDIAEGYINPMADNETGEDTKEESGEEPKEAE
ncbi:MAG: ferritin-like domain-containing protein [Taibaiella sp.]|nr:ferritin-like domain-containing protein [Taibaiella sp.]